MFLNNKSQLKEFPILLGLTIYSFIINWFSGNIGVLPIDSFGFLDTGYSILHGKLPIRDFWIFTGLTVDYMEAFFFLIFGNNWNSHLAHASFMNIIATISFYIFFRSLDLKLIPSTLYSLSFATLCYPVTGTPFAYIHSYIFSWLSIIILILAIKHKKNFFWFLLPFLCFFSFLSMQTPASYISVILLITISFYLLTYRDFKSFKIFLVGCFSSLILFIFFLFITKTPIINFIYQYILFPLTIGEGRLSSSESAYISLADQLNFKRIFSDFKFIHFFLLPLIFMSFKYFKKNKGIVNFVNFIIISSSLAFLFNQLVTANQIYIFSLIPILAAVLHFNLIRHGSNSKIIILVCLVVVIASVKFHFRYNLDRKFHDLENVDKSEAINASEIHKNFNNLKWINKFDNPKIETEVIKKAITVIKDDNREKILITHYQFISTFLEQNLNLLNRWYLWDNNTHPTENHKYFSFYKSMVDENLSSNNIKVIYLLGQENEISFDKVKNYFTDKCFKSTTLVEKRFSMHEVKKCK